MLNPIASLFGRFLYIIYNTVGFRNYGLAIIIFTVITKILLLPLTLKQLKSTAKMAEINPKIQEVQQRYKNDKEKLNQELMRIYQENKVNPASGCLPLLIQFPIIISLYWVITRPLKFMLGKSDEVISALTAALPEAFRQGYSLELNVLNFLNQFPEKLAELSNLIQPSEVINLKFLGLNLGYIPTINTSLLFGKEALVYLPLLLIPILNVVTTYLVSKMSAPAGNQDKSKGSKGSKGNSGAPNSMLYIGPIMTLIFSFQLPAGVGLYWAVGNIVQIFQQLYINKYVVGKKEETKEVSEK